MTKHTWHVYSLTGDNYGERLNQAVERYVAQRQGGEYGLEYEWIVVGGCQLYVPTYFSNSHENTAVYLGTMMDHYDNVPHDWRQVDTWGDSELGEFTIAQLVYYAPYDTAITWVDLIEM